MVVFSLLLVAGLVATSLSVTFPDVRPYPRLKCSEGWVLIDRTCFLLFDEAGTWDAGQAFCNQRGATLATISNHAQQKRATGMLSQSVWIGLKDQKEDHSFGWSDGSEYSYTSWDDDEPNNYGYGEHCVEMRQEVTYMWNNVHCNHTRQFLCSMPPEEITTTTTTTTTTATPVPVCEEGWEMFEDTMCYKVSDGVASWPKAREICLAHYARLAEVTSEAQQNFLAARLTDDTWIGLNDRAREGTFKWQDGTKPVYTNWNENEPNNPLYPGEDCTEMTNEFGYRWNDAPCDSFIYYACQKPPSTTCGLPSHT